MKQLILIMISVAFVLGCQESTSVEPELNSSDEINKLEEDLFNRPFRDGYSIEKEVLCDYTFNPSANCGGLLNGTKLIYRYDDAITNGETKRYLENVEIYVPSSMKVGKKEVIQTCIIYTLNRTEIIGINDKVIGGETWGSFKVVKSNGSVPTPECIVLFEGKFRGDINFDITKRTLAGKGINSFSGRLFSANEFIECNGKRGKFNCFTSQLKGKVTPVLKVEE